MVLNIFALIILIVIAAFLVYVVFALGGLPGRIARQRNHPQADAIRIMGWLGLLTLGAVWAVALVWAYITPKPLLHDSPSGEAEPGGS
jgi:membrane-bound acyltransferase YfiQ involved in biofilm formation